MFRRAKKSSSAPGPALELSTRAEIGDPAGPRAAHFQEWQDAARRVARTYKAWCAASRRDRRDRYFSFLDALAREERAARQLERDASALRAVDTGSRGERGTSAKAITDGLGIRGESVGRQ